MGGRRWDTSSLIALLQALVFPPNLFRRADSDKYFMKDATNRAALAFLSQ